MQLLLTPAALGGLFGFGAQASRLDAPTCSLVTSLVTSSLRPSRLISTAAMLACWLGAAEAQEQPSLEVTIPAVTVPSEAFRPTSGAADFLGVSLTQTMGDVRKILGSEGFVEKDAPGDFLLDEEYCDVEIVATGPNRYITHILWTAPEDTTATGGARVDFSSPLSGQRSTIVRRSVTYRKGQEPLLQTLRAAILDKYGAPSIDRKTQLLWFWSGSQLVGKDAKEKQMAITLETRGDYVKTVTYMLTDDAAKAADRAQVQAFEDEVKGAAKKVRDAVVVQPKL